MVRECCGEKQTKSCPSLFFFFFLLGVDVWKLTQMLCGLAQRRTDPHSSLSALMMCASAGPLQAQRGPVYQHSCPGYRPITQCQCSPHWLSVRLQSGATDRGRSWLFIRAASGNNCDLICNWQDTCHIHTCIMNKNVLNYILAAAKQLLYISASSQCELGFAVLARASS